MKEMTLQEYNMMRAMERQWEAVKQHSAVSPSYQVTKATYGISDFSECYRTNRNTK